MAEFYRARCADRGPYVFGIAPSLIRQVSDTSWRLTVLTSEDPVDRACAGYAGVSDLTVVRTGGAFAVTGTRYLGGGHGYVQ